MKIESRYIAVVCHLFCVLNSVTVPPQHVENFSRPLELTQCQEQAFRWHNLFSKGRNLVEGEQRSGRQSAQQGKRTFSI
jgi:hypothetical protein